MHGPIMPRNSPNAGTVVDVKMTHRRLGDIMDNSFRAVSWLDNQEYWLTYKEVRRVAPKSWLESALLRLLHVQPLTPPTLVQVAQGITDLRYNRTHVEATPIVLPLQPSSSTHRVVCNSRK